MNDAQLAYSCMCLMCGDQQARHLGLDAIFVYGRAKGEWESHCHEGSLALAAHLAKYYLDEVNKDIVLPGYGYSPGEKHTKPSKRKGYPGYLYWRKILMTEYHIPAYKILRAGGQRDDPNTKNEFDDFLEIALRLQWSAVAAVTTLPHALRAMLGAVQSMRTRGYELRVYPVWPVTFDWSKPVYGSQGTGPKPRYQWMADEWERIKRYQKKGDLATLHELYKYLLTLYRL